MRKFLFVLFLCAGVALIGCSTEDETPIFGNVYGTITDSKSGEPVRNAEVIISPGNKTTVSGSDGHFEFNNLEAGQYKIGVNANGYEYNSRQVTVVPGESVPCDIRLMAIVKDETLQFSTTSLDFSNYLTELSITITNNCDKETEWSVNVGNNNWLSASPMSGRISAGKSQAIIFSVDRDLVVEPKSTVINISAFGNTYPISISCSPKSTQGELIIEPSSVDFGENSSEETITIRNVGSASLNWSISSLPSLLDVSSDRGELAEGGSKVIKVQLDRKSMTEDLNTSFIISDGVQEKKVTVTASYQGGSGSGDNGSGDSGDDLGDMTIANDLAQYFNVSNVKCIGYKGTGIVTFSFVANGLKDTKIYFSYLKAFDSTGDTYSSYSYIGNVNVIKNTPVKVGYDTSSTQITGVSDDVKSFTTVTISCHPSGDYSDSYVTFTNVPIEWTSNDDSGVDGLEISNPYPQYMNFSNIECIGYKGSGVVHLSFTATNTTSSTIKVYFGNMTAYSADGDTYASSYVGNVSLPSNTPTKVKYNTTYTQLEDVDSDIKKFVTVRIYCSISSQEKYLTLTNVPIKWQ